MKKLNLPSQIETDRLILRKLKVEDGAVMFQRIDSNRKSFEEFLPWVKPTKIQTDTEAFIKLTIENWEKSISFDLGIFVKESENYIGNLGLHTISLEHLRGEFGYWLDGKAQGNGYMTEAVRAFEDVCFSAGLNRLEIRCAPSNDKSAGVPKKLGYQLDGKLRGNFIVNGKTQDTLVFSKIRSDLTPS